MQNKYQKDKGNINQHQDSGSLHMCKTIIDEQMVNMGSIRVER